MKPVLYVKNGCPWCVEAEAHLKQEGIDYDRKEVRSDPVAMEEMVELSGQALTPTMNWGGEVLADFGVDELVPFLASRNAG